MFSFFENFQREKKKQNVLIQREESKTKKKKKKKKKVCQVLNNRLNGPQQKTSKVNLKHLLEQKKKETAFEKKTSTL